MDSFEINGVSLYGGTILSPGKLVREDGVITFVSTMEGFLNLEVAVKQTRGGVFGYEGFALVSIDFTREGRKIDFRAYPQTFYFGYGGGQGEFYSYVYLNEPETDKLYKWLADSADEKSVASEDKK